MFVAQLGQWIRANQVAVPSDVAIDARRPIAEGSAGPVSVLP